MNSDASSLKRLPLFAAGDLKRCSAWLLTEGLTSVEGVSSLVRVDS